MSLAATIETCNTDVFPRIRRLSAVPAVGPAGRPDNLAAGAPDRAAALSALLSGYEETRRSVLGYPEGFQVESREQAERLALVCARIAGVWRLIVAHTVNEPTVPDFYYKAAVLAECEARDDAHFWRDTARNW